MPRFAFDTSPYLASYRLLVRDYEKLLEYIEPTSDNNETYSHRIYELLLRVCTECESVWRDMVVGMHWNAKKRAEMNGSDYRKLDENLFFSRFVVDLFFWRPEMLTVTPFLPWATEESLPFYADYNNVKHNRNRAFKVANFRNLSVALAALFLTLGRIEAIPNANNHGNHWHPEDDFFRLRCDGSPDSHVIL